MRRHFEKDPTIMKACMTAAGVAALLLASALPAAAQVTGPTGFHAGDILVRLRADGVLPRNSSSDVSVIGGHVKASDTAIPEIDLSYFFTPHIAVEAIAGTSRHNVEVTGSALGTVKVGSVWVLPPTVTLQYHFGGMGDFVPYVGAGLSVLFYYGQSTASDLKSLGLDSVTYRTGIGPAIEAGFDWHVQGRWYANFVVKQIFAGTRASVGHGTIVAHAAINPTIVGAGIGYRF
ncbi:OmpW family protein [Acidiphilium multivorum]|uniref:OmpW family protein n=2 Tax=Acidocellaceae TaxID=3385905 RepID=F0J0L2_ACIMA|nr:OmpW family protein [Acidiphilium multivorum]BAJ81548.1 OmpW family protein [Acidiphilium multivorum AIU301]